MPLDPTKTVPGQSSIEPITLRPATPADAPALALIGAATMLEAFTWMLPGADILAHCAKTHTPAAYLHYLADPNTRITLATAGAFPESLSPVGYAMLCTPELPTFNVLPTDIELKRIYLFSRFRSMPVLASPSTNLSSRPESRGFMRDVAERPAGQSTTTLRPAQAMMNRAIADARSLNRTRLLLGTHAENQRAIAFYLRNGFVQAGTRTFQVGTQLCNDLIFAKRL